MNLYRRDIEDALRRAMIGPTSSGVARNLAPVILDAIILGKIPGVTVNFAIDPIDRRSNIKNGGAK